VPVDHQTVHERHGVLAGVRVPVRPHFGVIGLAPSEADYVNTIPPHWVGGNIDDWRIGKGTAMYYPVAVPGALLSAANPHASQGDSELCGTAIECSLTGAFQLVLHKQDRLAGTPLAGLDYPLLETFSEWVIHGFSFPRFLTDLGPDAQQSVFAKSSVDLAMRDAFRKARRFLMTTRGLSEGEAISLLSVGVDFGVTQVVDGTWGVHAFIRKSLFASACPVSAKARAGVAVGAAAPAAEGEPAPARCRAPPPAGRDSGTPRRRQRRGPPCRRRTGTRYRRPSSRSFAASP
jgi:acetamidase/formamidase